jgi:hypothetical protein
MAQLSHWVKNSRSAYSGVYDEVEDAAIVSYVSSVVAAAILLHSYYLHRSRFDIIRQVTDLSAVSVVALGLVSYAIVAKPRSTIKAVILNDLIKITLVAVIEICDLYLVYTRYLALQRMRSWSRRMNHWLIWSTAVLFYLPSYTIMPFFFNTRSEGYRPIFFSLIFAFATIQNIYNLYFSVKCFIFLMRIAYWDMISRKDSAKVVPFDGRVPNGSSEDFNNLVGGAPAAVSASGSTRGTNERHPSSTTGSSGAGSALRYIHQIAVDYAFIPSGGLSFPDAASEEGEQCMTRPWVRILKIIAWKGIGHAYFSSSITFFLFFYVEAQWYWPITKLLGMHLWFNWRIEKLLCPPPPGDVNQVSLSRGMREQAVMMWRRQLRGRSQSQVANHNVANSGSPNVISGSTY